MERDDEVAGLFDAADEDRAYDEWRQAKDDEREMRLEEALDACLIAGVDREHLKTLVFETGATHWGLKQSLTVERKREKTWFSDEGIS